MDPAKLRYAPTHEWVDIQGDTATVGISRFAVDQLTGYFQSGKLGCAGRRRVISLALKHVRSIDAGGGHLDQHFTRPRPRDGALGQLQYVRGSGAGDFDGLHGGHVGSVSWVLAVMPVRPDGRRASIIPSVERSSRKRTTSKRCAFSRAIAKAANGSA